MFDIGTRVRHHGKSLRSDLSPRTWTHFNWADLAHISWFMYLISLSRDHPHNNYGGPKPVYRTIDGLALCHDPKSLIKFKS